MSEKKFLLFLVIILVAIPLFIGCFDNDKGSVVDSISSDTKEVGNLSVKMNFVNSGKISYLAPAGVTKVVIYIGSQVTNFDASKGEGVITDVPVGSKVVRAEGWNATGKTHESVPQTILIESGKIALVNVVMTPYSAPSTNMLGSTWTKATSSNLWGGVAREGHTATVYDNAIWVIGGNNGSTYYDCVWYSSNGVLWNEGPSLPIPVTNHSCMVQDNRLWVIGGVNGTSTPMNCNDVWFLSGSSWYHVNQVTPLPPTNHHGSVTFGNKLWAIGLNSGDAVWYSDGTEDFGVYWNPVDSMVSSGWHQQNVVFDSGIGSAIWSIGGSGPDKNQYFNGSVWTPTTADYNFPHRYDHQAVASPGKMWVIGGEYDTTYFNDVWYTGDGESWNSARQNGESDGFPSVINHASVYFQNKLWVIGGYDGTGYSSDVWHSGP